jgi:antimicrobial peptide system SdpA family protein
VTLLRAENMEEAERPMSIAGIERMGVYTVACFAVVAAAIVFLWIAYLPSNPLSPQWTLAQQSAFKQVVPEGWGFFTKSQRDEYFTTFRMSDGKTWKESFFGPQSEPASWFGFSRVARSEGLEFGLVTADLSGSAYTSCSDALETCFAHLPKPRRVVDKSPHPLMCGKMLVVWEKPIPWSWTGFKHVTQSSRIANLDVRC